MTTKDLVAEMLPTLCARFMGQERTEMIGGQIEDGKVFVGRLPNNLTEDARELFDALEALEREQKIRDYARVLARSKEIRAAMQRSVSQKRWKMAQALAAQLVVELTSLPILALVVLVQEEHKVLVEGIDKGAEGFVAFEHFATSAQQIITDAGAEELRAARLHGRAGGLTTADPRAETVG